MAPPPAPPGGGRAVRVLLLTIGSRGDVQPFVALALAFAERGRTAGQPSPASAAGASPDDRFKDPSTTYQVILASHEAHRAFVEAHGVAFLPLSGSPHALMATLSRGLLHLPAAAPALLAFLAELFDSAHAAALAAAPDLLVAAPSLLCSTHLADAMRLPLAHAFFMPWHRTAHVPHPFLVPPRDLGRAYNLASHVAAEEALQFGARALISAFRRARGLPTNSMHAREQRAMGREVARGAGWRYPAKGIPTVYGYSPSLLPKPPDWGDEIDVCGAFTIPSAPSTDSLPPDLLAFLQPPATPSNPIIYVGFGSIVPPDPPALLRAVVDAAQAGNWRVVLARGWAHPTPTPPPPGSPPGAAYPPAPADPLLSLPPAFHVVPSVPHGALFPHLSCAVHHGGSGTLSAALLAGVPSVVVPFFGDQYLWARECEARGVGKWVRRAGGRELLEAVRACLADGGMAGRCREMGRRMGEEGGAERAADFILERAGEALAATVARRKAVGLEEDEGEGVLVSPAPRPEMRVPAAEGEGEPGVEELERVAGEVLEAMEDGLELPPAFAPVDTGDEDAGQLPLPTAEVPAPRTSRMGALLSRLLSSFGPPERDLAASVASLPGSPEFAPTLAEALEEGRIRGRTLSSSTVGSLADMEGSWTMVDGEG
ncbi:hypothetical protein DFJ74DRAFT_775082 [Hyaloraphidium curvatum]|nr:hypothetical protein DFJ74DRAFT_775082 [Hyaloraphidium curvatum]